MFVGGFFFVFETSLIEHCRLSAARDVAKLFFLFIVCFFVFVFLSQITFCDLASLHKSQFSHHAKSSSFEATHKCVC